MDYFALRDGSWWCEEVALSALAERYGTPLYVYSRRTFTEHFEKLDRAFSDVPHLLCYSVKANGNLALLREMGSFGAGADVVSGGELERALRAGIPPEKIVYSGVGKTDRELQEAVGAGILAVNCENLQELQVLSRIAARAGRCQSCFLRINPDVDADTHAYLTTGRAENKFGISREQLDDALRLAGELEGIRLHGLDFHLGSQILTPAPYTRALEQARRLVGELRQRGFDVRLLDIGGGLAARYLDENPISADQFHDGIIHLVRDLGLTLVLEPGRFIMANAGVLLCRVLFIKEAGGRRFVITDAGMNDLIRPALYGAQHRVEPVEPRPGEVRPAEVVGPICESGDFLARDRRLPRLDRGDLLLVFSAGAYGMAMASNYNQRPRAAEALVSGTEARLVRRRESYADLLRCELEA